MSKTFFVMISTDPDIDPMKSLVALACTTQATSDGHEVNVFFAANAVKLLQADYLKDVTLIKKTRVWGSGFGVRGIPKDEEPV